MRNLFLFLIFLTALSAQAQILEAETQSFNLSLTPEFPLPQSQVKAKITSFTFDADRAQIQWILNGRTIAQGVGVKEVSFQVGAVGSAERLGVIVLVPGGGTIEKNLEIRPLAIDLLAEPENFVPFWYKGGKVISPGSVARVVALPHFVFEGTRLDPRSLIYNWKIEGEVRGDLSGRGRQAIKFRMPQLAEESREISVNISSPQGTLQAEARTFLSAQAPELLFYEKRPLFGLVTSEALSFKSIPAGTNLEIEAVPFFMNFASLSELGFRWSFEGKEVAADSKEPNSFLVRSEAGIPGEASIALTINNLKRVLEEVRASLNVMAQ